MGNIFDSVSVVDWRDRNLSGHFLYERVCLGGILPFLPAAGFPDLNKKMTTREPSLLAVNPGK